MGTTGTQALSKVISTDYYSGIEVKSYFKDALRKTYDSLEEWYKVEQYLQSGLDKIGSILSDEEIENILCVE